MRRFIALLLLFLPAFSLAVCIEDDTAQKICLEKPAARVISLYGAYTEIVSALGAEETIIARTKNDDTVEEVKDAPVLGTGLRPNIEYILALRPDLVLSRGSKASAEAISQMRARGIAVAAFDPESVAQTLSAIERIGALLGRETQGKELAAKIKSEVEAVASKTAKVTSMPAVAFEVRAEPLTLAGSGGIVAELIKIAGGEVAVKADKKLVRFDMEALLALNPDAYVVQSGPMNKNPPPPAERPFHRKLKAVKEGRVLVVDEKEISRPGVGLGGAAETLGRFLHPELWR